MSVKPEQQQPPRQQPAPSPPPAVKTDASTLPPPVPRPLPAASPTEPVRWVAIQVMQSSADLNVKVDYRAVASKARNCIYEPRRLTGMVLQVKNPRATATVFHSGRMICMGGRSDEECLRSMRHAARQVQLALLQCSRDAAAAQFILQNLRLKHFSINNVAASGHLGFKVDLNRLSSNIELTDQVDYEPEQFPGARLRLHQPSEITVTVFYGGSVTLTGGRSSAHIYQAFDNAFNILTKFAVTPPPTVSTTILTQLHPRQEIENIVKFEVETQQRQQPAAKVNKNKNASAVKADPTLVPSANIKGDAVDLDDVQWE